MTAVNWIRLYCPFSGEPTTKPNKTLPVENMESDCIFQSPENLQPTKQLVASGK